MTGHTEYCGSTELGPGAFRANRVRVGCSSPPDHGTAPTEWRWGECLPGCSPGFEEGGGREERKDKRQQDLEWARSEGYPKEFGF